MNDAQLPFFAHESAMSRMERANKRLWIIILILILALVGTNAGWICYESQFTDEVITQEVDTGIGTAVVSGIGDAIYGESKADDQTPNP